MGMVVHLRLFAALRERAGRDQRELELPDGALVSDALAAAEQIEAIVAAAIERHGLCTAAAEHRIGRVERSEASVIVAASAPHRAAAFDGAREIIDEIKRRAPIWKREEGEWVAGKTPPAP